MGTNLYVGIAFYNHGSVHQEAQVVDVVKAENGRKQANISLCDLITQQESAGIKAQVSNQPVTGKCTVGCTALLRDDCLLQS